MAEDPFEKARKEMERAQGEFHERMQRIHDALHQATAEAHTRIAEARAEFEERMGLFRAVMRQAGIRPPPGLRPPPGPKKRPRGPFPSGKPRRPDWNGPDRGGPLPTPVRPNKPSLLSGGAEAPLDE